MIPFSSLIAIDFLQTQWFHNSLRDWLASLAMAAIVFFGLMLLRRLLITRFGLIASHTMNNLDDMFIGVLKGTRPWVLASLAIYVASQQITLPARLEKVLGPAAKLVLLWQAGLWGGTVVTFWIKRYMERRTDSNDRASIAMISAMGVGSRVLLWALLGITALQSVFGISITALITGLGVGGIAVALAVQNILGDVLAALAIVFDHPFDVGDFIVVGDVSGTVEQIGLKTTRIRALSGEQIVIGNADLLKSRLRNFRRMVQRRVLFTLDLTYETPPDKLERVPAIIKDIISTQESVRFDRSHVAALADWSIKIETVYIVLDADYNIFMDIQQRVYLEILRRLEAEGIEIAYPTQTILQAR